VPTSYRSLFMLAKASLIIALSQKFTDRHSRPPKPLRTPTFLPTAISKYSKSEIIDTATTGVLQAPCIPNPKGPSRPKRHHPAIQAIETQVRVSQPLTKAQQPTPPHPPLFSSLRIPPTSLPKSLALRNDITTTALTLPHVHRPAVRFSRASFISSSSVPSNSRFSGTNVSNVRLRLQRLVLPSSGSISALLASVATAVGFMGFGLSTGIGLG